MYDIKSSGTDNGSGVVRKFTVLLFFYLAQRVPGSIFKPTCATFMVEDTTSELTTSELTKGRQDVR